MAKIRNVTPDEEKAKSLRKMAENTLGRIRETDAEKYPTQILKDYYDVIHYYLEALCTADGKKIDGRGAHAELISFAAEEYQLDPSEKEFLQNLRRHRNRISYEGFFVEPDFLERNKEKIEEIVEKLRKKLREPHNHGE